MINFRFSNFVLGRVLVPLLLFLGLGFNFGDLKASHLMGGDLTYSCIGGNTFRIRLTLYRDCAGINMNTTETIAVNSTSCSFSTNLSAPLEPGYPIEVSALCSSQLGNSTCNGGSLQGVQEYVYSVIYTLPSACTDWVFSYSNCCRNYAITTGPGGQSFYFEATLNNVLAPCNNSPDFFTKPVPYFGVNQPQTYSHATTELDGDNLVYSLTIPKQSAGTNVTYIAPWSFSYPITTSTGTFPINSTTGQMTFTPTLVQNSVTAVLVQEFRGGQLIGSVRRDIQLIIINGGNGAVNIGPVYNLNGATANPGQTNVFTACAGTPMTFQIQASDPNGASPNVTNNAASALPGASLLSSGTNPRTLTFNWTPPASSVGYNSFYINVSDNFCPIPSLANVNIVIYVAGVEIVASSDSICSGQQVQLGAYVYGNAAGTYAWTGPGLSSNNIPNPTASPPTLPQSYTVTYSFAGCTSSDNLSIYQGGSINAVPPSASVCPGQTVQFNANAYLPYTINGASCGLGTSACATPPTVYTIGSGSASIQYPYSGYWHDGRTQMLYMAAELTASGLTAGNISAIALNVASKGSTIPYTGFTLKIGCTNASALTGYTAGLTTVYAPGPVSTTTGWNTYTFSTPYQWDGTSNLVVEICFNNTGYTQYDYVAYTTTSTNTVYYRYQDNAVGCNFTTGTPSTSRPNMRFTHCPIQPPINYTWTPASGLNATNIANPVATAGASNTTYYVQVTGGGCTLRDTIVLNSSNIIDATPDSSGYCGGYGFTVNLNAFTSLTPVTSTPVCGTTNSPCGGLLNSYSIGAASQTADYPFSGYFEDGRTQMLFTAAELLSAGLVPGKITAMALNVQSAYSTQAYTGFTISIGCTNITSLTAFQSGLTNVFTGNYSVGSTTGWKAFNFTNGYGWDGTSNLVVQICFNNTSYTDHDYVYSTTTPFQSVYYSYTDGVTGCTIAAGTATNNRPVVQFSNCSLSAPLSYTWSPPTGLNDASLQNPVATPLSSTVYSVTVSNGVCNATDNVEITVDNCILPVGELEFTASLRKEDDYYVQLNWNTKNESNTDVFELQRRYPDEIGFEKIGTVNAMGNTNNSTYYKYQDRNLRPVSGEQTIYYRLREVDTDGSEFYTPVIEVKIAPDAAMQFNLYPNPASKTLNLEMDNNNTDITEVQVSLTDNLGRVMPLIPQSLNNRKMIFDISGLSYGSYILTILTPDGKRSYKKFVKSE